MGISPSSLLACDTKPPIPHPGFVEESLCDSLMESVSVLMGNLQCISPYGKPAVLLESHFFSEGTEFFITEGTESHSVMFSGEERSFPHTVTDHLRTICGAK